MQRDGFNDQAKAPHYTYERNPVHDRSYRILKWEDNGLKMTPVGDYTLLDFEEGPDVTEKKMMNLVSILNERKQLIQIGDGTQTRLLYQVVTERGDDNRATLVFYVLREKGVSTENAILRIEADCLKDIREIGERQCAGASDSRFVRPEVKATHEVKASQTSPGAKPGV